MRGQLWFKAARKAGRFIALMGSTGCLLLVLCGNAGAAALVIDHTTADLSRLTNTQINLAKSRIKWHYAHTSHGSQLDTGLRRLYAQQSRLKVAIDYQSLARTAGALCIFDGQETETYITPELYWESTEGKNLTRDVLNHNPTINVSMWSWCSQMDYYNESQVRAYLSAMDQFQAQFPKVTFVYMTGNAQATGEEGYNRYRMNNLVRAWVKGNPGKNRVLYDFADLDSWWKNPSTGRWEQATYRYNGVNVPVEHPKFHGDQAGHTTFESCEQKGRAAWFLVAGLASRKPTPTQYYRISGLVRDARGKNLRGVRVTFQKAGGATTNANGYYVKSLKKGWTGTLTPNRRCYRFRPTQKTISRGLAKNTRVNFRGYPGVTVAGCITLNGKALARVRVLFSNKGGSALTNARGCYTKNLACGWRGSITPSRNGYTFTPARKTFGSRVTRSLTTVNFKASK